MKIGLRAGHSDNCTGAIGIVDEHEQMKLYYAKVESVLLKYGHSVINCNSNGSTEGEELSQGATKANNNNVDLFISLHMNSYNGSAHGTEVLVSSASSGAYNYAKKMCTNFNALGFTNRGVKYKNLYEMNHIEAPNIIFEICFCDSQTDINIYNNYSFEELAYRFCNAIDNNIPTNPDSSLNLGWNKNSIGWWYCTNITKGYYYKDEWKKISGDWYSFDSKGYARQSAWLKDGEKWYYLKDNCVMAKAEWLFIDGEWYCFDEHGALYVNCITKDNYTVDETGAWVQ